MKFEMEKKPPKLNPTEKQMRASIARLRSFGPSSFASLSDEAGNYVQVAGGGIACLLERHEASTGRRFRGFKDHVNPNYPNGTLLVFGAGEIALQSDEWFHQNEAADVFAAFLRGYDYAAINWRETSAKSR